MTRGHTSLSAHTHAVLQNQLRIQNVGKGDKSHNSYVPQVHITERDVTTGHLIMRVLRCVCVFVWKQCKQDNMLMHPYGKYTAGFFSPFFVSPILDNRMIAMSKKCIYVCM